MRSDDATPSLRSFGSTPPCLSLSHDPYRAVISFKHFVTSTFTDLSRTKRFMLKGSLLLIVIGLGAKAFGSFADSDVGSGGWSWTSVQSGIGYIGGFLIGAAVRLFFKLSLAVAFVIGTVMFALSKLGWVDAPFHEMGEFMSAFTERAKEQITNFQEFLSGFLPASMMSGLGVASGVTQKPDWTPDDD